MLAQASLRLPESTAEPGQITLPTASRSYARVAEDQLAKQKAHEDFVQCRVNVPQQTVLQFKIRLRSRKQILHDFAELGAALHEADHAAWHRAEKDNSAEKPFRETRTIGQIQPKI